MVTTAAPVVVVSGPAWLPYVQAAGTFLTLASVIVAAVYGFHQVAQSTRAREMQVLQKIFDDMASDERHDRRARVLSNEAVFSDWTREQRRDAYGEIEKFQQLGFFVRHKLVRSRLIFEMYSLVIIRMWDRVAGYVSYLRDQMGAENFGRDFEAMAGAAHRYRISQGMRVDGRAISDEESRGA